VKPFLAWELFCTLQAPTDLSGADVTAARGGRAERSPVISAGRVRASALDASEGRSAAWARSSRPAPSSRAQVVCPERKKRPMRVTICNATAKTQQKHVRPLACRLAHPSDSC